jgi:hypothetical protein
MHYKYWRGSGGYHEQQYRELGACSRDSNFEPLAPTSSELTAEVKSIY